ncbi:MAG TPA: SusD/RagB family nutrient-binding outer membrane lipoprotein [Cyclobacteriaceae bacterium]
MKKIINYLLISFSLVLIVSCDNGFDELNTSKTGVISLDPAFVLNNAVINSFSSAVGTSTLTYEMPIVQQMFSSNTGVLFGGNFNQTNITNTPLNWINYFQNVINYASDVISRTKNDAKRANLYNMARIIKANAFMVLTQTYGDMPYSEAGAGYTANNFFPKYDTQQSIYADIIKELTEASGALDASGTIETSDVLYNGNIVKWKKFGYSLLLRAGMRLTKADAATAQTTVAAAFASGVILSNADNAIIKYDANFANGIGSTLTGTEAANFHLGEPFVDFLKNSSDPRLAAIAVRYVGANSGTAQTEAVADRTAANQYGLPVGSTDATANAAGALLPGGGTQFAFTQADRTRVVKKTSPMFIVTAGQTNLLLAEAAFLGWIPGGFAAASSYYVDGITAHMNQMASYDAGSAIAASDITAYFAIAANQLTVGTELKQIGEQYWVASFLNGPEAWANFRRTGFPALTPNPYSGSEVPGDFINRVSYPPSEILVNSAHVQAAISVQGPDVLATKMWLFK